MYKRGLKQVARRRDDALSRVRWDRLEVLLARHYAAQGFRVEHVGTGGTGRRFDGGIDLKLRRDDAYILVQCKGWNAYKVPHNEVHQLIGLMVNEGATDAILVTTGEFTRAAIEAAARGGHVQLVDGDDLRRMLGPLPEEVAPIAEFRGHAPSAAGWEGASFVAAAGDRLLRQGGKRAARAAVHGLGVKLAAALFACLLACVVLVLAGRLFLQAMGLLSFAPRPSAPQQATQSLQRAG